MWGTFLSEPLLIVGMAVLFGNIARDGCVVKTAGVAPELWHFEGPAVVFDSQEDACGGILYEQNVLERCH